MSNQFKYFIERIVRIITIFKLVSQTFCEIVC